MRALNADGAGPWPEGVNITTLSLTSSGQVVSISAPDPAPNENFNEGDMLNFTLTRTGSTAQKAKALTVNIGVRDVDEFNDYVHMPVGSQKLIVPTTVTFAENETAATLTLATTDYNNFRPMFIPVTVTIKPGDGYLVGSSSSAQVLAHDDGPFHQLSVSAVNERVTQGNTVEFTFTRESWVPDDNVYFGVRSALDSELDILIISIQLNTGLTLNEGLVPPTFISFDSGDRTKTLSLDV